MSASRHTPGGWHADGGAAHILGRDCIAVRTHCANYATVAYVPIDVSEANAALIAAAPDLLQALRDLVGLADMRGALHEYRAAIGDARAVIAKATGAA